MLSSLMLMVAALAAPSTPVNATRFVGIARSHAGGAVLYRERHFRYGPADARRELVLYTCPDGKPFARKTVGGDGGPAQAPDFELYDARNGYREGVRGAGGRRVVFVHRVGADANRVSPLPRVPDPVIDSGFDAFLRAHWTSLMAGQTVDLSFLVPSRRAFMDFEVYRHDDKAAAKNGVVVFRLRLASWFGFALPHIDVAYTAEGRELRWFHGLSNLRDMQGRNITVTLRYPPDLRTHRVSAAAIETARTAPLDGHCRLK